MKKTYFLFLWLAVGLAWPLSSPAQLLFYGGVRSVSYTGENYAQTLKWKMILLVDYGNTKVAEVSYATINGQKHYFSSYFTNAHFVTVTGKANSFTVIAHLPSQCELDSGVTTEGVFCTGANSSLTVNAKTTLPFAKTFSGTGSGLYYSSSTGDPITDTSAYSVSFDQSSTIASNQSGETLDAAIARLSSYLQTLGYTANERFKPSELNR
jgi:hypothetical protein